MKGKFAAAAFPFLFIFNILFYCFLDYISYICKINNNSVVNNPKTSNLTLPATT